MRAVVCTAMVFVVCWWCGAGAEVSGKTQRQQVLAAALDFEQACLAADTNQLRALLVRSEQPAGSDLRRLITDLQRLQKREKTLAETWPLRVRQRQLMIEGETAVVTELLGAKAGVELGRAWPPQRRTLVWNRQDSGWKLLHLHASTHTKWEKSIASLEQLHREQAPTGGIVFVGSSSMRLWKTLADDFPQARVWPRGFGGSHLIDSVLHAHRIVLPLRPHAVAVYAGDNDVNAGKPPQRVLDDFRSLVQVLHAEDPGIRVGFVSIKPSLKRWELWPRMREANRLVAEFARQTPGVDYLDIATAMLGDDQRPRPGLFAKDGLHLNAAGYGVWTRVLSPWVTDVAESTP